MVEMIMALATTGILATAIMASLSQTLRLGTSTQNEILAFAMAQELMDNARNTLYGNLVNGTYDLLVNRIDDSQTGPSIDPRPLLLDNELQVWGDAAQKNLFNGTVTETIADGAFANTKEITIAITWQEGHTTRKHSLSTTISASGIHN